MRILGSILQRNYGQTKILSQNTHENTIQKTGRLFSRVVYRDISLHCPLRRVCTIQLPKPGLQQASQHNPCRLEDITPVASLGYNN